MKRTPLYEIHVAHKARIVDFAGWAMPMQYSGVLEEYHAVRTRVGLFDVSHMGRLRIAGAGAVAFLQRVTTNDVRRVEPMASHYSMVCNPDGGVKDDVFLYRLGGDAFLLCVNAANLNKMKDWLARQRDEGQENVAIVDQSDDVAQLALQGPESRTLLQEYVGPAIHRVKPRQCLEVTLGGVPCVVARTGYTGELGYEFYVPADRVRETWNQLLRAGERVGLKPAGLGARDLLRLDLGYLLYGNDLNEDVTPIEANAAGVVSLEKGPFVGEAVIRRQAEHGTAKRLVAFELLEKAVPRHAMPVCVRDNHVGTVTSGNLSPMLQKGIGLACVASAYARVGTTFEVEIRGRRVPARVVSLPFYKKPGRQAAQPS